MAAFAAPTDFKLICYIASENREFTIYMQHIVIGKLMQIHTSCAEILMMCGAVLVLYGAQNTIVVPKGTSGHTEQ